MPQGGASHLVTRAKAIRNVSVKDLQSPIWVFHNQWRWPKARGLIISDPGLVGEDNVTAGSREWL